MSEKVKIGIVICGPLTLAKSPEAPSAIHDKLGTWSGPRWDDLFRPTLGEESTRLAYD